MIFNEKIADLKPLITNNHKSKIMFMLWTTLNLLVQAYESNNHCILIIESRLKEKKNHARDWYLHANMECTIKHTCY